MFNYNVLDLSQVEFLEIAPAGELPEGERMFIEVEGRSIVVINLAGKLHAIGDICSHDNGPVGDGEIEEHEIICPRHGARFDIRSGKVTSLPAVLDIPSYPVRVVGGMIEIGLPKG
ncbi:MAG: non-heme iron oxygenase ferredoxin subunit [Anaerolineales bacterium]|jgi:3-phenylpropionate/trans-cinnamate dioxygenase ferredoxin subunit